MGIRKANKSDQNKSDDNFCIISNDFILYLSTYIFRPGLRMSRRREPKHHDPCTYTFFNFRLYIFWPSLPFEFHTAEATDTAI